MNSCFAMVITHVADSWRMIPSDVKNVKKESHAAVRVREMLSLIEVGSDDPKSVESHNEVHIAGSRARVCGVPCMIFTLQFGSTFSGMMFDQLEF